MPAKSATRYSRRSKAIRNSHRGKRKSSRTKSNSRSSTHAPRTTETTTASSSTAVAPESYIPVNAETIAIESEMEEEEFVPPEDEVVSSNPEEDMAGVEISDTYMGS